MWTLNCLRCIICGNAKSHDEDIFQILGSNKYEYDDVCILVFEAF